MKMPLRMASLIVAFGTCAVSAADLGTADNAKAMLQAAALAVAADEDAAMAAFTAGKAPFKDHDLYVFCFKGDVSKSVMSAHGGDPALVGQPTTELADKVGTPFVKEMWQVARAGEVHSVDYMWPRPGEVEPADKSSYVTLIGDQLCGVGYYK